MAVGSKTIHSRAPWRGSLAAVLLVGATTSVGLIWRSHLRLPDMVALYLLAIAMSATSCGRGPSLLAAALSVLANDFFFVPPVLTFAVSDLSYVVTFAVMFIVGVLIGGLTIRIRRHERQARLQEGRTAALYELSQDLSEAEDEQAAASLFARRGQETFGSDVTVFLRDGQGRLAPRGSSVSVGATPEAHQRGLEDARSVLENGGATTSAEETGFIPLKAGSSVVGALTFNPPLSSRSADDADFLDAFAQQGALALRGASLKREAAAAALRVRTEEMKNALLSTVSHDLRTPLAAITGAATTLRDDPLPTNGLERTDLLDTICEEADRLDRLVRNLLDMTKVESDALDIKREWVPLEEIVGAALTRLERALDGRFVETALVPELPLLSVDPVLLEQVFVNLLENAVKYTPEKSNIEIGACIEGGRVVVTVGDRGPGLPPGAERRVFEKFFRASPRGAQGVGLGLAICRGIIEAHGGAMNAQNRPDGGAVFAITLPLAADPPSVPADVDSPFSGDRTP